MARYWFGGTANDGVYTTYTLGSRQLLELARTTLRFYDAETDGTQHTDLLDSAGNPVDSIVTELGQVPRFQGPDGVAEMWADDGDQQRHRVVAIDVTALNGAVTAAEAARDEAQTAVGSIGDSVAQAAAEADRAEAAADLATAPTDAQVAALAQDPQTQTGAALSATFARRHTINVEDHGAVGDWSGTTGTDNLAAFNAAVAEAVANGRPTTIVIPEGRFRLSDSWLLDGDNIEVHAEPGAEVLTTTTTTYGATVTFMGNGVQTPDNTVTTPQRFRCAWRGGKITATGSGTLDNALGFVRYEKVLVEDVVLDADRKGLTAQYGVNEVDWDRVTVTRAGDDGLAVETDCNRVRVRGFYVEQATGRGILVTGSTGARCSDVNILDGVVTSATGTGVLVQYADRVAIDRVHVAAAAAGYGLGLAEATKVTIGPGCNFTPGITYGANVTTKTPRSVTITGASGWVAFGSPHATPRAFKTADGMVVLSGAFKSGATTSGTKIGELPVGYRPDSRERFIAQQAGGADTAADLYVDSNGDILIAKTLTSNVILSLSGITFPAA